MINPLASAGQLAALGRSRRRVAPPAGPPLNPVWSELVESPTGVPHGGVYTSCNFVYNGFLYVAKGWSGSTRRNDAARFDLSSHGWTTLASDSGGQAVRYQGAARIGSKLHIIGGETSNWPNNPTSAHRVYDIDANTWSAATSLPAARLNCATAVTPDGAHIYVCGGRDGSYAYTSSILRYDVASGVWSSTSHVTGNPIANAPVTAAFGVAMIWDDVLYYFPGYSGGVIATMYKYDLTTDGPWTPAGAHPAPVSGASSLADGGRLWMYSGYTGSGYTSAGYLYDASTETFSALNSMAGGGVSIGWMGYDSGKMFAGSGYNGSAYTQDVQEGV